MVVHWKRRDFASLYLNGRLTSCLTIHALVSKLAKMAAAVVAQAIGAVNAGGVWSAGLCGSSGHEHSH